MNAAAIAALCQANVDVDVEVVRETGSTNADLMARAAHLERPTLLIAEHQSAGRGRAGRSWLSNAGDSLTFSLAWKFAGPPQQLLGLPLAVGVALAEALVALNVPVRLKWPNDLLKDGSKLGGILIETVRAEDKGTWAVIGVGLNLLMPDQLEERIGARAASAPWLAQMERNALMAALLAALAAAMAQFATTGFKDFRARWDALHAWRGQPVVVIDAGAVAQRGVALGVDDIGRLLLDGDGDGDGDGDPGRIAVLAGDVSLRLAGA